ncbi:VOC family protein [Halopseudomonas sabulinigri]|uniref:VOC family protein n=1 Tax=Halopseudomonas sabulinigri TaxID=472181 RepID=A0ABP9ZL49_9GAMM
MQLTSYLSFDGNCADAFAFYHACLGGELEAMPYAGSPMADEMPAVMQDRIMHVSLSNGEFFLMGCDVPPSVYQAPQGMQVALQCDDLEEAQRRFDSLSADGQISMPLQATFWSTGFAMFTDRFGIQWMINCTCALDTQA